MRRIDFYLQHLVRHSADGIVLESGSPVTFEFQHGNRSSASPIEHEQIRQLVTEVAPADSLRELQDKHATSFVHEGPGVTAIVTVEQRAESTWHVRLVPSEDPPPQPTAQKAKKPEKPEKPARQKPVEVKVERPIGGAMAAPEPAIGGGGERPSKVPPPDPIIPRPVEGRRSIRAPKVKIRTGEPRINRYLREMVRLGASDLHLSSKVEPMVRLHGEMQMLEGREPLAPEELASVLDEIMPERNRTEFTEKWDTDFAHTIEDVARFRVNCFRDRNGVGAVFRQIPFEILSVKQLGLPPAVLDLCWLTKGLVVVTGPTGSGKSTTLATLVDYINENRADHIITIEDPIEFVHANKKCLLNQREVGTHTKNFKNALRAALREDPDIVLVGEMRDLETIAIAIETAETGHLVFGTLHTVSAKSTVDRIIDQFPADRQEQIRVMLSESLRGVIAQVLCKKKGGGRVAGYEVMIANPAVSNLIREGKTFQLTSVLQTGKKLGMQTMNDHLLEHVRAGLVDADEAYMKSNDKQSLREALSRAGIELKL